VAGGYTSEVKFLVGASVGRDILQWVREHLAADDHGGGEHGDEYRVTSLYFDTAAGDVFNRRGSYGRSKYRVRRYEDEATVFLERKLRTAARLAKRRTQVDMETLGRLAAQDVDHRDPAGWFARRLDVRRLRPVCQVSYLRVARQAETPAGAARLTVDAQLAAIANTTCGFVGGDAIALLDGQMIVEIKYRAHVPVAFKQLVERFQLHPRPASKYRLAAQTLGVVGIHA
jgi:hypothetical protein